MHILLLSRYDRMGASSRVRFYQYMPYLRAHGITVTVAPFLSDEYICDLYGPKSRQMFLIMSAYFKRLRNYRSAWKYDLVWIEKEVLPWLPACAERWLNQHHIPFVIDFDDAIFHKYDRNRYHMVRRVLGNKIDEVMRRAALVVVGNAYLADRATQAGAARVEVLPTVIDLDHYCLAARAPSQLFTIGWIGTPVTAPYLHEIESALAEVCRANSALLVTVGSGEITLKGVSQEIRSWSEQTETIDIQSFDCGIMPLPDADWERGKCGYKLIQYMACGLPVVASPVGVNCQIVDQGVNGFLASNREEWIYALMTLRDDPGLRKCMGNASRRKIERQYCLQITAPQMLRLLESAAANNQPVVVKDHGPCVE